MLTTDRNAVVLRCSAPRRTVSTPGNIQLAVEAIKCELIINDATVEGVRAFRPNVIGAEVPPGVDTIGAGAFSGCGALTSITLPNSLTSIGSKAFRFCPRLTSVEVPRTVIKISQYVLTDYWFKCSSYDYR